MALLPPTLTATDRGPFTTMKTTPTRVLQLTILMPHLKSYAHVSIDRRYEELPDYVVVCRTSVEIPTEYQDPRLNWDQHVTQPGGVRQMEYPCKRVHGTVYELLNHMPEYKDANLLDVGYS